jgi:polyisoprenoid-binding protein YceI
MKRLIILPLLAVASAAAIATMPAQESRPAAAASAAGSSYKVDSVHSSVVFRVTHANVSPFWGMFTAPSGSFTLDSADPTKSSFNIEIKADNVVTGNEKRDNHLRSPDFFNAKQYPTITFTSTSVAKGQGETLMVTGTMDLHGVKKELTIPVEITGKAAGQGGRERAGIEATMTIKMSDFEFKGNPSIADEVRFIVGMAGVKG